MQIGFIGLGKMGLQMAERLLKNGHKVVAYDLNKEAAAGAKEKGIFISDSYYDLVNKLDKPKVIWLMVPAGEPTQVVINALVPFLENGDIVVDGGNSFYKDSISRANKFKEKGVAFLDVGVSGGISGGETGYCLMVGGERSAFNKVVAIFKALAFKDGYVYIGVSGTGHFIKMVHNGIEYALLQSYAEGFEMINEKKEFNLDLASICHLWNQGSVIRSWVLELAEGIFKNDPNLESVAPYVADSGEGRWTVIEAINEDVPAPVITLSLLARLRSRQKEPFSDKVIAALRNKFGGHFIKGK